MLLVDYLWNCRLKEFLIRIVVFARAGVGGSGIKIVRIMLKRNFNQMGGLL
jgi:cell division GTPase FtsZ